MDAQGYPALPDPSSGKPFARGKLGNLDAAVAARVAAVGGDVAMVIDRDGVICDMALSNEDMAHDGAETWLDKRWSETVTVESRHKVTELLRDALASGQTQWREVNQITPSSNAMMMRFVAVDAGHDGRVIAIGRDDRQTWAMQQRLMESQQAIERDYAKLRDAESRYKLLFQFSGEGVVFVDAATRKVIDANPAAERLVGEERAALLGRPFGKLFDPGSQDEATSLLTVAQSSARGDCTQARLFNNGHEIVASASLLRQTRATQCLVRLTPADHAGPVEAGGGLDPQSVLDCMPDAFLVTDAAFDLLMVNTAFLDLVGIPTEEQALGQSINEYLGRAGLERNILLDNLREHGSVLNFTTLLRNRYGDQEDVEVSAVAVGEGPGRRFGFTIRGVRRRQRERSQGAPEMRRSVEQLTELVGRVKLKELVSETTDLVERLCIEAALELTKGNRASAAEVLGLSRQSLYSKLHRFGLGNFTDNDN